MFFICTAAAEAPIELVAEDSLLYVNESGSIQEAINAASPGDTIIVESGTYYENVDVNKTGIILRGMDTDSGLPVVNGTGGEFCIKLSEDNCTLEGFNVTDAEEVGIWVASSDNTISDNIVCSETYGFYVDASGYDFFEGYDPGLEYNASNNTFTDNTVYNNGDSDYDCYGIFLYKSGFNEFTGNMVSNDGNSDYDCYRIYLYEDCDSNVFTGNTLSNAGDSDDECYGIYLDDYCDSNVFTGNTLSNNGEYDEDCYGIYLEDYCNSNKFTGNTLSNAGDSDDECCGIYLYYECNSNVFTDNTLSNAGDSDDECFGIYLEDYCNSNEFTGNTLSNNGESDEDCYGIYLYYECNSNVFTDNTLSNADDSDEYCCGIYLEDYCNSNEFTGNTLSNAGDSDYDCCGIYLEYECNSNDFTDNTLSNNGESDEDCYGIYLYDYCEMNTFSGNAICGNFILPVFGGDSDNFWSTSDQYSLNEADYQWINITQEDLDWSNSDDDYCSENVSIGFDFTLDGVTYTWMEVVSNGVIHLIPEGGVELGDDDYDYASQWANWYPDETFIFALSDDLDARYDGWYGYKSYLAGDTDSGGNAIPCNLTVIDYHTATYEDSYYSEYPNDFQIVLYEDGTLRFNFNRTDYRSFEYSLDSGLYLGNDSSEHSKELMYVARAGDYENETSFSTPISLVSSSHIGNYYGDVYSEYSLTESAYQWINTNMDNATWNDTSDDDYSEKVPIGFNLTLDGVNYTHMQVVSNGVIQLIPAGSEELNDSSYDGFKYWVDTYPDETFIFALCDDLSAEGSEEDFSQYTAASDKHGVESTFAVDSEELETLNEKAVTENDKDKDKDNVKDVQVTMESGPIETALMESTFPEVQWYGYTMYSAEDNDSEENVIPCNLTVIDYHVATYEDLYCNGAYDESPLEFQVVLYENGTIRFNFKRIEYSYFDNALYSGMYLGNDSSIHAKELVHAARAGQYVNGISFGTPVIRTLSSSYDAEGDGIADSAYDIASYDEDSEYGIASYVSSISSSYSGDRQTDSYPLVLLSEANAPSKASSEGTVSFTVSTRFNNPAGVGVEKVELYCKKDDGDWSKYGENGTGIFTFSTSEAGDYYFYTVATDVYGNVEGLPDDYDSHTAVSINSESSRSNSDGPSHYQPQPSEWEEKGITFREPADSANVKFDKEPVYAIAVDSKNPFSNARFRTKNHAGQPSGVPQPEGTVYKYTDIEFVSGDCDIEGASIFFKVDKAWLEENGLDSEDVKLLRYHDGEWMELETTVEDEDADYFYFSALTPGFSTFAIIAEGGSGVVDIEPSVTGEVPAEETASEVDKPEESGEKSPGFSIFAGVLGLVVCFYMRRD
ncbi:PGF-pre-PGF domain-containing protein [Methanosarcina sp. Mfa9]|uniref:PGF-pre-PGF domain-containing protein n=1 Tax=Methanosarcina sp. Mfa9 TaxID=3439063 RepID=UPI003F86BA96